MQLAVKNNGQWLEGQGDANGNLIAARLPVQNVTVLPSATRNSTTFGAVQVNNGYRGFVWHLDITASSGTGGLTIALQWINPLTGGFRYQAISAKVITAAEYCGIVYPEYALSAPDANQQTNLPYEWQIQVTHSDGSNYTYSLNIDLLP